MKYSQASFKVTCDCGREFYVVFQSWGRIEKFELTTNYKCLKCDYGL